MPKRIFPFVLILPLLFVFYLTGASACAKEYADEYVEPTHYVDQASFKLARGLTNIVTSPVEIPKQIVLTTKKRGAVGSVLGILNGVGMTVIRAVFGVWETGTFFLPNNTYWEFDPILKPEFVWDEWSGENVEF